MNATASDKLAVIDKITANSVYMEDSGFLQGLQKALGKLSKIDLDRLALIIEIKVRDGQIC